MFAELLGKEAGYCKGKGGSMHIADPDTGNLGANAIVGGSAGIATGAAFAAKYLGHGQVAVCFFGEGALGQGVLYEEMNMAQLWKLPVIYVCENNLYNEYTHFSETTAGDMLARPTAFGVAAEAVDGQDVRAVHEAATRAVVRARARGEGPAFLLVQYVPVSRAPRGRHQRASTTARSSEEQQWKTERDPIALLASVADRPEDRRSSATGSNPGRSSTTEMDRGRRVCHCGAIPYTGRSGAGCLCLRRCRKLPEIRRQLPFVTDVRRSRTRGACRGNAARPARLSHAVKTLPKPARRFKVLTGLVEEFGTDRVMDTPISEAGFTGLGVGAAMTGLRPVVDIMFGDFLTLTMDQMVNQAAKIHYMSGGKWKVPMVMRATMGATRRSAAQHSQSLHAWLCACSRTEGGRALDAGRREGAC